MGRGDLTDEPWAALEPLSPKGAEAGRPPVRPRRQRIDGMRFGVRTGVPWRDVPVDYGPWNRVYDLFRRSGPLPRAPRGRARDQPPQTPPCRRHQARETRRPLRGDRPHRGRQRVAVTGEPAPAGCLADHVGSACFT
ncbi:transposase [Streptomyces sp. PanSC19]|uniref:transposase n=1 Tax=Streptomyces sp. PanSC19 TaxID=1520455 RepID=UPI0021A41C1C|nr:transposase [Streptomyces sp. PanSC19]